MPRLIVAALALGLAVVISACSGGGGAGATGSVVPAVSEPSGSGEPSVSGRPSTSGDLESPPGPIAWEWDADVPDPDAHPSGDVGPDVGDADGDLLPDEPSEPREYAVAEGDPLEGEAPFDPCTLVLAAEWAEWTKLGQTAPQPLEDGDVCGWIAEDDRLRMAIGVFPAAGEERWLYPEEMSAAEALDGIGDAAWWLEGWPVAQSSTLVIAFGDLDLVIEMSAADPNDQALLQDGARHFAALAEERLP